MLWSFLKFSTVAVPAEFAVIGEIDRSRVRPSKTGSDLVLTHSSNCCDLTVSDLGNYFSSFLPLQRRQAGLFAA